MKFGPSASCLYLLGLRDDRLLADVEGLGLLGNEVRRVPERIPGYPAEAFGSKALLHFLHV